MTVSPDRLPDVPQLTSRIRNCAAQENMTVDEFARLPYSQLRTIPNLGRKSIDLLRESYPETRRPEENEIDRRRIVQISAGVSDSGKSLIYALCADGTLWLSVSGVSGGWLPCDPIPL